MTFQELLSLHQLFKHAREPVYTNSSVSPGKIGVLTHSSYWNYYNKMKELQQSDKTATALDNKVSTRSIAHSPTHLGLSQYKKFGGGRDVADN